MKGLQGNGPMAFEIIQNADDAKASKLCFDATDRALILSNDAEFTSCGVTEIRCPWERDGDGNGLKRACNFHAISKMGARSKINAEEQTGRFGIGFVSVYQITDTPIVQSGVTRLVLNPLTGEIQNTTVEESPGTTFELPWASKRSDIRDELNASVTPDNVVDALVEEVSEVLRSSLIFLRHLRFVEVRKNGVIQSTIEIRRSGRNLSLIFGPKKREENWLFLSDSAEDLIEERNLPSRFEKLEELNRKREVNIAIPMNHEDCQGRLYAYLPTQHFIGMPFHINADFFPVASRQDIVLKGDGHERFWNEALIETAANAIEKHFSDIRDSLTSERLWEIGEAAFERKEDEVFSSFWSSFSKVAKVVPSIQIKDQGMFLPADVQKVPAKFLKEEKRSLQSIGLRALPRGLNPYSGSMKEVGLKPITLSTILNLIEEDAGKCVTPDNLHLEGVWSAVERLLPDEPQARSSILAPNPKTAAANMSVLKRLKEIDFLLDLDGKANSVDGLCRVAEKVTTKELDHFDHECPRVDKRIHKHPKLTAMVSEYGLDDFARFLRNSIAESSAEVIIGESEDNVRDFYKLLTSFPTDDEKSEIATILQETPCLKKQSGFVSPKRALLPSGFSDPTGYFEIVDTTLFSGKIESFVENVLGVQTLSLHDYIDLHLETIIENGVAQNDYRSLLTQIAVNSESFEKSGTYDVLAEKAFLRTVGGDFVASRDCLYRTKHFEKILGTDSCYWLDEGWLPSGNAGDKFRNVLEKLGLPTNIESRHIASRIDDIEHAGTPDEIARLVDPVIQALVSQWPKLDRNELRPLKELRFIPALRDSERDNEQLYLPSEVYQVSSSKEFSDQVPVIDLPALSKSTASVLEILEWFEIAAEPETSDILEHLTQCMSDGRAPAKLTYKLLNERLKDEDDAYQIGESLKDEAFIWNNENKEYMRANQMFWSQPPFGNYWWKANSRMGKCKGLYTFLGVSDSPDPESYASLALSISNASVITQEDIDIHTLCLVELCKELDAGHDGVQQCIKLLSVEPFLLNLKGESIWPEDAVWIDSEKLSKPLEETLKDTLVCMPGMDRSAAARFFKTLGVPPFSQYAKLKLALKPYGEPVPENSRRLRERAELLSWLAPNSSYRLALLETLANLEIQLTDSIWTEVVYTAYDPPTISPRIEADAFLDQENDLLFVSGEKVRWITVFKVIFSELEKHAMVDNALSLVARGLMEADTYNEAERDLLEANYSPPEDKPSMSLGREFDEGLDIEEVDILNKVQLHETASTDDLVEHEGLSTSYSPVNNEEKWPVANVDSETDERGLTSASPSHSFTGASSETDEYKSKAGNSNFGAGENRDVGPTHTTRSVAGAEGLSPKSYNSGVTFESNKNRVQKTRTERMLSYVSRGSEAGDNGSLKSTNTTKSSMLIDLAAIKAVHKYEESRGWKTEEQPHGNPGFDIKSFGPGDERRLIEVKGLDGEWTGRGIKISHTQFKMAQENPTEFWIYVVEKARDSSEQKLYAISNPFGKVKEYWFDHNWRDTSEVLADAQDLNAHVGSRVQHSIWGLGTIEYVEKRGLGVSLKVNFGDLTGTKYIPFNDKIQVLD